MIPQDSKVEHKVKILKDPRLRNIRYRLRTLLFSLFELKKKDIFYKMGETDRDDSLSYDGKRERRRELRKEKETLVFKFIQSPINCAVCGNRENDLIYQLNNQMWVCHNREDCHKRIEENVQDFRKRFKERLGS